MITEETKTIAKAYVQSQTDRDIRRQRWAGEIREMLCGSLETIKLESGLAELSIQKLLDSTNLETINIGFNQTRSGIVEKTDTKLKSLVKHGGRLCFIQSYTGKIFVLILYPWVDEVVSRMDNKLLGEIEPTDLTNPLVIGYFNTFLQEMVDWETRNIKPIEHGPEQERTPIGFQFAQQ